MKYVAILFLLFIAICNFQAQTWEPFGNTEQDVTCLYYDSTDNSLYIGGIFLWFDSLEAKGLVKWDGQTFSTVGDFPNQTYGIPPSSTDAVSSIIKYKDELYCSMRNGAWNSGEIRGLAKWNEIEWDSIAGIDGQVFEQIIFEDELYIMGRFWERNDSIRSILKWDGIEWYDVGFQSWLGLPFITILAATIFEGDLYVGGNFWNTDGSVRDVARFDGTQWHPVAGGVQGGFDDVGDLIVYKGELYACGDFKKSSGNIANKIMKLKNDEWVDVGGSFELSLGTAFRMLVYEGKLYVFGDFDNIAGGINVHKIAIWDGEKWCGLDHDFNKGIVYGELYEGDLIIGGGWELIDGKEVKSIARWTGEGHVDTCGSPTNMRHIDEELATFETYPNPTYGHLSIENKTMRPYEGKILDVMGREMGCFISDGNNAMINLDLGHLPKGVYFIHLYGGTWIGAIKIITQ